MSVRLGIIGYGIMGERLLRAAMAHDPARISVAAVFDPSPAAQQRLASDFPAITIADSAEMLIAASDCVYIASPPASHLKLARAAIAAGKAVFCEKPLATDLEDARAFAREAADARFAVNFPLRLLIRGGAIARLGRSGCGGHAAARRCRDRLRSMATPLAA